MPKIWVRFMDMHSGGNLKLPPYQYIYIETDSEAAAIAKFTSKFGRDPYNVTCDCCGEDYSISSSDTLEQATGYDRNCDTGYLDSNGNEVDEHAAGAKWHYIERQSTKKYYGKYIPLNEYLPNEGVLVIRDTGCASCDGCSCKDQADC
jgi:hypothetical protein